MKKSIVVVVIILVVGGLGVWWWLRDSDAPDAFRTIAVKRGAILATISATGTVEPTDSVDVGAQVAGIIDKFGDDPAQASKFVDFRSEVKAGQLLAHIDDTTFLADKNTAAAEIDQANANVAKAQADLAQVNAKLVEAQRDWERAQKIGPSDALSENDYDMYQANYETAKANVGVDEATVKQNQAAVVAAKSDYDKADRNWKFCTITSPVDGEIIARRVNIGQTVVSSLSAPSLFLIGTDMRHMDIWASVNEADTGSIYPGQPVTFTVDAFPGRTFKGVVSKLRYDATMTQNVVTYTVEISVDNFDRKLIPYLTANVQFELAKRPDVLMVPDAALHWVPQVSQVAPQYRDDMQQANKGADEKNADNADAGAAAAMAVASEGEPRHKHERQANGSDRQPTTGPTPVHYSRGMLWVKDGEFVKPIKVKAGISDGANTEVEAADGEPLTEGTEVIVGDTITDQGGNMANPFMPHFGGGGGRGGGGGGRRG